ncbi:methyltransferase domain-containing protein [Actinomadura algeriensis]|uniref:Protein-L-isoaspartate O-methyltransferase n=1 Tax=Actinomadura algeriensis TaxID=1679523 RepID=A0ABR9JPG7_9ACTN|nr:methyltransferase domain-containing protein [Actinomadura algeriensis]MBE1532462.1 protein-L-isoaspartate(D-aspartate) O-methyltransferase [Actinomadura algeriensis]
MEHGRQLPEDRLPTALTTTMTSPAALAEELAGSGVLEPTWREAFSAVPRHRFIPDTVWVEDGDHLTPVHREDDETGWMDLCYANDAVVTQVDDGVPAGPGQSGHEITSSASRPDVVARMLAALQAEPGMSVLEIGTGTGWNAALLAERLGAGGVTSVEVDPAVADRARRTLREAGYGKVAVVTGDGALGHPPGAPFDRLIATVAVDRVPYAWVEQTRPGGRVVVPWTTDLHNGALVSFVVGRDGTMQGRIMGNVAFMRLRSQRGKRASLDRHVRDGKGTRRSFTDLHPYDVFGEYDASLAIGLRVPRCKLIVSGHDGGAYTVWLIDPWSGSWAGLDYRPDAERLAVRQSGERDLWQEVHDAYRWWDGLGRPTADRWGLTVTPEEQYVWLDTQDDPIDRPST